jgi:DMSO reductase anchor subunit
MSMENRFLHLVPLVVFTVMAIAAAGMMVGIAGMQSGGIIWPGIGRDFLITLVLAGVGIVVSFLHLGRRERFILAAAGVKHSWLSREVITAGIFFVSTGSGTIFMKIGQAVLSDLAVTAAFIAALYMTWTIGMVYNIPGRFTWEGFPNTAAPVVNALLLGSFRLILFSRRSLFEWMFFIMWLVDFLMALSRAQAFRSRMENKHTFVFPQYLFLTRVGHMSRLVLTFSMMTSAIFSWKGPMLFMIIGNIILDRLCFYAGAMEVSPKSEIASQKAERMKEAKAQRANYK